MIGGSANAQALLDKLNRQLQHVQNLTTPLQASGDIVRSASVQRIKDQGGDLDWAPNKRGGHTGLLTGRMMGAIQVSPPTPNSVSVNDDVSYARYFQEGTGIYAGHQPWTIKPVNGKALAFSSGGKTYVRREVTMPGQPARPFMVIEEADKRDVLAVFNKWLSGDSV